MLPYLLWQTPALWESAFLTQKAANSDVKSHLTYPAAAQMHLSQCYTGDVFVKNFKEKYGCSHKWLPQCAQIIQVCPTALAKAKTWQSPLLSEQQDSSLRHKAVLASLPAALSLSLLRQQNFCTQKWSICISRMMCCVYDLTFPKPVSKPSSSCRERCTTPF